MPLGKSQIRHLTDLARLQLNDSEIDRLAFELESVVRHFDCLPDVDTSSVESSESRLAGSGLRADAVVPSLERHAALANGPNHDGEFFHVPGVIRR